jgi:hypothetical protein
MRRDFDPDTDSDFDFDRQDSPKMRIAARPVPGIDIPQPRAYSIRHAHLDR